MRKPTVTIYTLGCRLNQVESEAISEKFAEAGFDVTQREADLHIVNSCTVTGKAEQKMRRVVRDFSKHGVCIVTGCAVKGEKASELERISPNVIAVDIERKHLILDFAAYMSELLLGGKRIFTPQVAFDFFKSESGCACAETGLSHRFDFSPSKFHDHHKAYLKVQDGCDRHCAFCAVSLSRGKPTSLESEEAIRRFCILQDKGYKEICLTGVNLALYDNCGGGLAGLLAKLECVAKPDVKVRLTSLEPDLIDKRLIEMLSLPFICDYFHLPIQSASAKVLALTGRKYDSSVLESIIAGLREAKGNPFISADIMAGLPGEDDMEAETTFDFLKKERLSYLHVFPFSKREGTPAFFMKAPEQRVRDERAQRLRELSSELLYDYSLSFAGKSVSAIIEKKEASCFTATSDNYLKINVLSDDSLDLGQRCRIIIEKVIRDNQRGAAIFGSVENAPRISGSKSAF